MWEESEVHIDLPLIDKDVSNGVDLKHYFHSIIAQFCCVVIQTVCVHESLGVSVSDIVNAAPMLL